MPELLGCAFSTDADDVLAVVMVVPTGPVQAYVPEAPNTLTDSVLPAAMGALVWAVASSRFVMRMSAPLSVPVCPGADAMTRIRYEGLFWMAPVVGMVPVMVPLVVPFSVPSTVVVPTVNSPPVPDSSAVNTLPAEKAPPVTVNGMLMVVPAQ